MPYFNFLNDSIWFLSFKYQSAWLQFYFYFYFWKNQIENTLFQWIRRGILFWEFSLSFWIFMPGGRARGNPVQILSENCQKIPWILLKNFMFLDITIESPCTWYMNFGPAPLGWDFSIFGTQCIMNIFFNSVFIIQALCTINSKEVF